MVDINMIEGGLLMPPISESGALVSFNAPVPLDISSLKVAITPVQSGTGDPSPTNIRPITGWTGAKIAHCGKNLISLDMLELPTSGTTIKDTSGEETSSSSSRYTHGYIPVKPNTTYTFRGIYTSPSGSAFMYEYGEHKEWIAKTGLGVISAETSSSVRTTSPNTHFIQIQYIRTADPSTWSFVEGADTDTYPQGTTYPISWSDSAGTVYGGELDVLTGKLTAYPYYASYAGETINGEWISDRDVYAEGITPTIGAQVAVISGTGTEYQLTPTQVQTLLGINNIWADCGDITLKTSPVFGKLKIRLMEEGISIVDSSPLLRSESAPVQNTEEDTKTVKEPIEDIVKEPVDEKDTVKELPEDENEPEPEDEEVTEDDNEG